MFMKHSMRLGAVAALLSGLAATQMAAAAPDAGGKADLILTNGEIYTPAGWARALAIRHGVILAVGDPADVEPLKAEQTRVLDLKGAAVVPGLHDMHVHPLSAGLRTLSCNFEQGSSAAQIAAALRKCAQGKGKGEWITGGRWDASSLSGSHADRRFLDRIAPENPVVLTDISGHSAWASSQALRLAGITKVTPDPAGGFIERDAKGEPNGFLRESAAGLVRRVIPEATDAQRVDALRSALHLMLSSGVTSLTDAIVDGDSMKAYDTLSDLGELKQRVKGCMPWHPTSSDTGLDPLPDYIMMRNRYARERFSPSCVKIFLDGVPTDSHTAAMVEPYVDAKGLDAARARGVLMVPPDVLNAATIRFDRMGLTVKYHAAGDAAVREGLDAIEAARKANGYSGLMHEVGHNSFIQESDIPRARAIGATFEMSPYIWYPNPIIPDVFKAIGPERMKRWIPVREAIESGALVVPGSDWPVVPSANPWIAIETLVTRRPPGGGGDLLGEVERITIEQAFDMFTVNSAREMGNASRTGQIGRGLLADLLVLDRNPFRIPVTQVHETKVRMVLINGEIVYNAQ